MKSKMILTATAAVLGCALLASPGLSEVSSQAQAAERGESAESAISPKEAHAVISSWPDKTKEAAQALIEKYGQPDGAMDAMLVWNDKGEWKQVTIFRDPAKHSDPMPHEDFLENKISYKVPESKVGQLIEFNRALVVDRTRDTLASHCDNEKANTLALNLANEIVTGKRDVASAKKFMKSAMRLTMAGKSSPYTEKLMFKSSVEGTEMPSGKPGKTIEPAIPENPEPQTPRPGY